ncbi:MAG TPA: DUF5009 domain-containing protein [Chryseosolibacter sp.]|nr:DUF5009 domain-containing protein [Chryseosolibacter sp.]
MEAGNSIRVASIDVLRAITMVLMIFVNDLWSLENIPLWLEHVPADADGLGLADIVFPAFLLIVGMSIPLAVSSRGKKGDSQVAIAWHIITRGVALIVMGLFLVNGENINESASVNRLLWNTLSCTAFILLWNHYPSTVRPSTRNLFRAAGIVTLIVLAIIYKAGSDGATHGFSIYWWGILGLIGWAYLLTGLIYVAARSNFAIMAFAWISFNVLCVMTHLKVDWHPVIKILLQPFGSGAMPAFVCGGVLVTMIFLHFRNQGRVGKGSAALITMAFVLLVLGFYLREFWGISKIRATPSWVWICSSITIAMFVVLHFIVDMFGKGHWFNFIRPGGTNTLICYIIPYFAYAVVSVLPFELPALMLTGIAGLFKSLIFALLTVALAGVLQKWHIQIKL